jgi:hypothetical protein
MAGGNAPSWVDAPELWDVVTLAGKKFPCAEPPTFKLARNLDKKTTPGKDGSTLTDKGRKAAEVSIALTLFDSSHWKALASVVAMVRPKTPKAKVVTNPTGAGQDSFFIRTPYGPGFDAALQEELLVTQPQQAAAVAQRGLVGDPQRLADAQAKAAREKALAPVSVYHPALSAYGITTLHLEEITSPRRKAQGVYEVTVKGTQFLASRGTGTTTPKAGAADNSLSKIRLAPELAEQTAKQRPSTTDKRP